MIHSSNTFAMPVTTARRGCSPTESPRSVKRFKMADAAEKLEPPLGDLGSFSPSLFAHAGPSESSRTERDIVEEEMGLPVEFPRNYAQELDYRNKLVLAPMVRTGSRESLLAH